MALLIREFLNLHDYALDQWRDPRVDDWMFMSSVWKVVTIIGLYLYFVLDFGPKFMENRKPFNLDKILIIYNSIQVIYCTVLVIVATIHLIPYYSLRCEPCDYSQSFRGVLAVHLTWWYFMLKVIDLMDTVFFVLRNKNNQITFLHVYHHTGMVIAIWVGARFIPGGTNILLGYINSIVHIIMYSYYNLTVWKKDYKDSVWWKKHITHLQLIQFGLVALLYISTALSTDCKFQKWPSLFLIPQSLFMVYMFGDFYFKAYVLPKKTKKLIEISGK